MDSKAISDSLWDLLQRLNSIPEIKCSYLGGGTALALQMEHRISEDLDLFITEGFDDLAFKKAIQRKALTVFVVNQTPDHLELMLQSIKVDLIRERIPLKFPLKSIDSRIENLKMADPRDIGRMKIMSIGSRGNKKDFVDLYCLTRKIIPLETLLALAMEEDHGIRYSKLLFLKGLVDFEEADQEGELPILWDISWKEVKKCLIDEVKHIARKIQ